MLGVALLLGVSIPAAAAAQDPATQEQGEEADLHVAQDQAQQGPKFWFQLDVSPSIVSDQPFASGGRTTDSTVVGWTLGYNQSISPGLDLSVTAGPKVTLDADDDAEEASVIAASVRIGASDPILLGMKPFARYSIGVRYNEFFEGRNGTAHEFTGGLTFERRFDPFSFGFELSSRLTEVSGQAEDYFAVLFAPELNVVIARDSLDLHVDTAVERRWYDDLEASPQVERRDWRFQGFFSLDFAKLINRRLGRAGGLPRDGVFRDLAVGVRILEVDSNIDEEDRSSLTVAPAIAIRIPLN